MITAMYASVRGTAGHVDESVELGEEVDRLSSEIDDPALRIVSLITPIYSRWVRGRLGEALALADEAIALGAKDPTLGGEVSVGVTCPYAFCLMTRGLILAGMGYLEESACELDRALRVAQEQGDLSTQSWAHGGYVVLARFTREVETVLSHATQGYEIAERIGDAFSRVLALYCLGYARLMVGEPDEAITALERSIELGREARTGLQWEALLSAGLAEALLSAGDHQRALDTARESVTLARERGNESMLAVACRVLAEALLAGDGPDRVAAAKEALDQAAAAVEATGARAELHFIERAREKLVPVG